MKKSKKCEYLCLDTNVLIRLANGEESVKLLCFLREQVKNGSVRMILPETVEIEWNRNKTNVVKHGTMKRFDEALNPLNRFSILILDDSLFPWEETEKKMFDELLEKLKSKKPVIEKAIQDNIDVIDSIINNEKTIKIKVSNSILIQASRLALEKKAPFGNKNSFADAVIVLSLIDYFDKNDIRGGRFVSINTKDFCEQINGNYTLHSDLMPLFEKNNTKYFRVLGEAINSIDEIVSKNELDEMSRRLDEDDTLTFCEVCDGNKDDWANIVDFTNIVTFSNRKIKYTSARVGYCNYCNSIHIECPKCFTINGVIDFNDKIECEGGCGCRFEIIREYDSDGIDSNEYKLFISKKSST